MAKNMYVMDRMFANALRYNGETVLTYEVHYPHFTSNVSMPGLARINMLYKRDALHRVRSIQMAYYVPAVAAYRKRQTGEIPFTPYEFAQQLTVTYMHNRLISLHMDDYQYTGGAHGLTVRTADTWNAKSGAAIPLSSLFPPGVDYVSLLTDEVFKSIRQQTAQQEGLYLDNVEELVRQTFDENNFFLTPQAIVIFFQQVDIAPYATGIPTFAIPYGMVGAEIPRCR